MPIFVYYFLSRTGAPYNTIKGLLAENFVYLSLKRRIENTSEIAGIAPWFAFYEKTKAFMSEVWWIIRIMESK